MLGNEFLTHGDRATVDAVVENRDHPASAPLGAASGCSTRSTSSRAPTAATVTMLLSLDRHPADGLPEAGRAGGFAARVGQGPRQGRVFYTALGHRDEVWRNPLYQQHVLGGLRWILDVR